MGREIHWLPSLYPAAHRRSPARSLHEMMMLLGKMPSFRWWSNMSLRTKGFVVVSIPLCAMLLSFVVSYLINREQDKAESWVQRSTQMRSELDRLLDRVTDAGRGVRSYQFDQNEEFLEPYRSAKQTLPSSLLRLLKLAKDSPPQKARLRGIQSLVNDQITQLSALVEKPGAGAANPVSVSRTVGLAEAKHQMDALRQEIGALDAEEQRLQIERTAQLQHVERWRSVANAGGVIVGR